LTVCIIRQQPLADGAKDSPDLIAAVEAIMADGATWFTRTILERVRSLRHGSREGTNPHPSDLDVLSERELEVLGLICEGRTDTRMSEAMGLSQNTVRNHIASLYRKIGVNRRGAAIIWARERGVTGCNALPEKTRRSRLVGRHKNDRDKQSDGASY
jgi:DNA-binding NarL/FixJ family response regulator